MWAAASDRHHLPVQVGVHAVDVRGTFDRSRPAIVLVHGLGMSGQYFLPYADLLAASYDVYVLDLPGYGKTPNPDRALTTAELGGVLAEVVSALGLDAPVLVGHSMGCQIVANAIAKHPALYAGYILIGPTADPSARSLPAHGLRLLRDAFVEPPRNNAVVFRDYLRMGPLRYLHTARHMLADRTEDSIQLCTIPGLVVRGERDPIASAEWTRELVRVAPNAELVEIKDGPHVLQLNLTEELAAACRSFFTAVTDQRPGPPPISPGPRTL